MNALNASHGFSAVPLTSDRLRAAVLARRHQLGGTMAALAIELHLGPGRDDVGRLASLTAARVAEVRQ